MTKLTLLALAAVAFLPGTAFAQAAAPVMRHGGGVHHVVPNVHMRHFGPGMHHGMHRGMHVPRHRLHRGFFMHPFFFGPQFHVQNWQLYGFVQPGPDQRWVRYYDDAYLLGPDGRVMDERYGLDWDEYGERWDDEDGIPHYEGHDEWRPGEPDYAWVEQQGGYAYGPGHHATPYPGYGYGYGAAYPYYGWGVLYPGVIVETTVTTGGGSHVETVVHERRRHHGHHRPRARCDCEHDHQPAPPPPPPPPRPRGGQRG